MFRQEQTVKKELFVKNKPSRNIIVLCGPTASGKTTLGVALAQKFNGEIVSADSRQVYKGMDIGTGKDLSEYSTLNGFVPYHLIDIVNPDEIYTLYHYKSDSLKAITGILERGHIPVLVGGTGLYIEALLRNYDIPCVPENPQLRNMLLTEDYLLLKEKLENMNPELYNKTDLSSKKRIIRSIEIALYLKEHPDSDKSTSQSGTSTKLNPVVLCTRWNRAVLWERIDLRLKKRLDEGMVDEVRRLLNAGISQDRFALFGMEYKHIAQYLKGETDYDTMVEQLRYSIHRLAKRQETWFRGMQRRGIQVSWIDNSNLTDALKVLDSYNFTNEF